MKCYTCSYTLFAAVQRTEREIEMCFHSHDLSAHEIYRAFEWRLARKYPRETHIKAIKEEL